MMMNEKDGSKERWIKQYSSGHNILLIGEGDFSFSLSLAMDFGSATKIVATTLDSYDGLVNKYKNARSNVAKLKSLGATMLYGVDATNMANLPDLQLKKFDRIIYNFPHAGFPGLELESDPYFIMNLVRGFLRNASNMLSVDGEVHINHEITTPFDSWKMEDLALDCSLIYIKQDIFDIKDYPLNPNKNGPGRRSDEASPLCACSSFKFKLNLDSSSHQTCAVPPPKVYDVNSSMDATFGSDMCDVISSIAEAMRFCFGVPLFSVEDYEPWKLRMENYLSSIHYNMWTVVKDGPIQIMRINTRVGSDPNVKVGAQVPKPWNEMSPLERELRHLDNVAKNVLISSVTKSILGSLRSCKSAKDMWDTLALMCEGTIKENRLYIAVEEFERFKMLPEENIDQLEVRFTSIMTNINFLGKEYTRREVALKILRSLPSKWYNIVDVMKDNRDLSKTSMEELFSKLKVYEFDLEITKGSNEPSRAELKDQLAMMTRRFEKLNSKFNKYKKYYNDTKGKHNKHDHSSSG